MTESALAARASALHTKLVREKGSGERGTCAECGEPFIRRTKHRRLFCDIGCQEKAKRRRYRAKPEVKARIAKYMREWNRRRVSHDGV